MFKIGKVYKVTGMLLIHLYTNENHIRTALEIYYEPNFSVSTEYPIIILEESKEKTGVVKILIDGKVGWFDYYRFYNEKFDFMFEELE